MEIRFTITYTELNSLNGRGIAIRMKVLPELLDCIVSKGFLHQQGQVDNRNWIKQKTFENIRNILALKVKNLKRKLSATFVNPTLQH